MQVNLLILLIVALWLAALSAVSIWIFRYFRRLSEEVERGNLIRVLDEVLEKQRQNSSDIEDLRSYLNSLEEQGRLHIQKLGLVRFNPFEEMGGGHSFSLALLDGTDNGVIITGLHARERTRVYVKNVKKGKSAYELSQEEKKALKIALKAK